jgi:hypothetical protein
VDPVKEFLDLFLATTFVGINSEKRHCMLLVPASWQLVSRSERFSSLAAALGRVQFVPIATADDEGCERTYPVTPLG